MTNLEMYQIFAPFGPIAPRGATALLDKDREEEDKGIVHTPAYTLKNWKLWDGAVNRYGPPTTERERESPGTPVECIILVAFTPKT